jgi:hypothetical protein
VRAAIGSGHEPHAGAAQPRPATRTDLTRATVRIERLDGELLVLDGLSLARGFFGTTGPAGRDALSGFGNPVRIEPDDLLELNRMGARSPQKVWTEIVAAEAPWLAAVPPALDLVETGDRAWRTARGDDLVAAALAATIGPGRGMSVATKLLHLKRPRLFPMLDRLVAEMLGASGDDNQRVDTAVRLVDVFRVEGRRNLEPLRAVRSALAAEGRTTSLVRLLDAIVWFAHPAAGATGARRTIDVRLRGD